MKNFKRIAVVGGGIFGCTSAFILAKAGFQVDLFERGSDILNATSSINQYRLHKGYHYPRSKETAVSSREGEKSFLKYYGNSVFNDNTMNYYCIAQQSKLTAFEYLNFLDSLELKYEKIDLNVLVGENISLTIKVNEELFNPELLKLTCQQYLDIYKVNVHLNIEKNIEDLKKYDYIVNATYSNLNSLLPEMIQKKYQFELCEKPVIKLPKEYIDKSVVIMDGPFTCIDPLKGTPYHVMGNVVHAIHSTNIGSFPKNLSQFESLLNRGIVKNPSITNIDKFYDSAKVFFTNVDNFEHVGSMFTYRAVLPNRELDDARPTLVENSYKNVFSIFSGKIGTCVDAAKHLLHQIDKHEALKRII